MSATLAPPAAAFDPVHHTQLVFRALLDALARPGQVTSIAPATAALAPPEPWSPALVAIALTLLDNEVTFAATRGPTGEPASSLALYLAGETFATAVPAAAAGYVLVEEELSAAAAPELIGELSRGDLAYPEDGATLVVSCVALAGPPAGGSSGGGDCAGSAVAGSAAAESTDAAGDRAASAGPLRLGLSGPGVPGRRELLVYGLPAAAIAARNQACAEYPLGVDLVLATTDGRVAALPRTTTVTIEGVG